MKKIIATFVIFSGIFSSFAQDVTPLETVKNNIDLLSDNAEADAIFVKEALNLSNDNFGDIKAVFYAKYKSLAYNSSEENITNIAQMVTSRLQVIIPSEKYTELAEIEGAIQKLSGLIYLNSH